jgi:fructose-bisphosphate aldolase class I
VEEKTGAFDEAIPELAALLDKAKANRIFGTKMRSFIVRQSAGIKGIVDQQFELADKSLLRPGTDRRTEVDIHPEKAKPKSCSNGDTRELNKLPSDRSFYPLTLPEKTIFSLIVSGIRMWLGCLHCRWLFAEEPTIAAPEPVVASFSRALLEGLRVEQTDAEFDAVLNAAIQSIFEASTVKREAGNKHGGWLCATV